MSAPPASGAAPSVGVAGGGGVSSASTGVLLAIVGRLKDHSANIFKQRKPWSEVVDRNAFSKPNTIAEAAGRLRKNANYFKVNYLIIMLATTAATFLVHPSSLLVLGLLVAGWMYVFFMRTTPIVIGGRTLSDREKLLSMSAISFITVFFLTSVGAVLFSALSLSLAVIAAHGALREPDNLFVDEGEMLGGQGLLSIFTNPGGSSAAVATAV